MLSALMPCVRSCFSRLSAYDQNPSLWQPLTGTLLPVQGGKAVVVVIMEFCDMGTLLRAITKQAFKPHGKWKLHTTYVRALHQLPAAAKASALLRSCLSAAHLRLGCCNTFMFYLELVHQC